MSLKKLGATFVAVLALSAIVASSASAAATTTAAQWYTGASPGTTLAGSTGLKAETGPIKDPLLGAKVFRLISEVGSPLTKIELTATGIECVSCTIENKEVTGKAGKVAFGTGKIKFTGVTSMTPAACGVADESGVAGQVTTKQLTVHADFMNGTTAVQQFIPPTEGATFAAFKLTGEKCPVAGLYSVKGTLFTDAVKLTESGGVVTEEKTPTGTFRKRQEARISKAIETADGGGLTIGTKEAELTGTGVFFTSPEVEFAVK